MQAFSSFSTLKPIGFYKKCLFICSATLLILKRQLFLISVFLSADAENYFVINDFFRLVILVVHRELFCLPFKLFLKLFFLHIQNLGTAIPCDFKFVESDSLLSKALEYSTEMVTTSSQIETFECEEKDDGPINEGRTLYVNLDSIF